MKSKSILFLTIMVCCAMFTSAQQKNDTLTIIGVGDIMPGTNFPSADYLPPNKGQDIFTPLAPILKNADITIGNLEGCLLNAGGTVKKCQDTTKCYAFRIPTYFAEITKEAGFDVVNLANNHSGDFGSIGRNSTRKTLDSVGIRYAGLNSCPSLIFEQNGLRIGFCGFSPFVGTPDILNTDTIRAVIRALDSLCDIVIVAMHAGAEGSKFTHVTKQSELFYDEDRGNVYAFAHLAVDCGADVVLGHGPHVTRAVELYKDRFIAYSLGNFCTYARFNLKGENGVAPLIKISVTKEGAFLKAQVFSIKQIGEGGPLIDEAATALQQIIALSRSDFPDGLLRIDGDGTILKKP